MVVEVVTAGVGDLTVILMKAVTFKKKKIDSRFCHLVVGSGHKILVFETTLYL